jgi:hypothetical protein
MPFWIWLSSIRTLRHGGTRKYISLDYTNIPAAVRKQFSDTDWTQAMKIEFHTAGHLYALAQVEFRYEYNILHLYSEVERIQLTYLAEIFDIELDSDIDRNSTFIFLDVLTLLPLTEPTPLQQFGSKRFRGMLSELEFGQAGRLLELLAIDPYSIDVDFQVPQYTMRLPCASVHLITAKTWTTICLPSSSDFRSSVHCKWGPPDLCPTNGFVV